MKRMLGLCALFCTLASVAGFAELPWPDCLPCPHDVAPTTIAAAPAAEVPFPECPPEGCK